MSGKYTIVANGPGRAFVFTPGNALLGSVERQGEHSWSAQPTGSLDTIGRYYTRKDAAMALIRKSLRGGQKA